MITMKINKCLYILLQRFLCYRLFKSLSDCYNISNINFQSLATKIGMLLKFYTNFQQRNNIDRILLVKYISAKI